MSIDRLILGVLVGAGLIACSPAHQFQKAPQSQQEVGLIIQGNQQDIDKVVSASQSYRVISAKHGVYEVRGLQRDDVKSIAPGLSVEKNQFFKSMIEHQNRNRKLSDQYSRFEKMTSAQELAPGPLPPALVGCDPLEKEGVPKIELGLLSEILSASPTMNLGESAHFTAESTVALNPEMESLEIRWDLVAPNTSSMESFVRNGTDFLVEPDGVGMYQVILVAKNGSACGLQAAPFLVTHNPEILFATSTDSRPSMDLTSFTHLDKINVNGARQRANGTGIVVAVLDTGLHFNHPAIRFNLAINENEKLGSVGSDNDGNGFANDVLGWDFINDDNIPFDDEGHGSHVAGLISSHIHGSAPESRVLPLKVLNAAGGGDIGSVIAGIYYAVDNGAQVINASLQRYTDQLDALKDAIEYANSKNVVFVSSSGNDNLDLSLPGVDIFPGEIDCSNVINVGATGFDGKLASYSNYGRDEVDIAAPGGDGVEPIYSLSTMNTHDVPFVGSGGTSMAAPIVSGVVAMLLEVNPSLTVDQVRSILMQSGADNEDLQTKVGSGKLLDASVAVETAQASQTLLF